jgi:hypothetical protein
MKVSSFSGLRNDMGYWSLGAMENCLAVAFYVSLINEKAEPDSLFHKGHGAGSSA